MRPAAPYRPLHLAQIVYSFLPGGSEYLAARLAVWLAPLVGRSTVCALTHDGPLRSALESAGVTCRYLARRPGVDWALFGRLYRLFCRERVDIVQTHHLGQLVYAAPAARLAGARLVHVEHDTHSLQSSKARRQLRLLVGLCDRVVVVGEGIRKFLVEEVGIPPSRVDMIPNGVDTRLFQPQPRRSRHDLGLPVDGPLIGHVGRLVPEKDHATLLEAFRQVAAADPRPSLVLVGEGALRPSLEARARGLGIQARVHWLGARSDVAAILPHLDVFVLSSVREGAPLALLEAMAAGCPVVSTDVGEIGRLLVPELTGLTVAPADPHGLAAAIHTVLSDAALATRLGQQARSAVEENFSLDKTVRAYERLLNSLGSRSRGTKSRSQVTPCGAARQGRPA